MKKRILWYLLDSVFFVVFNLIFFMIIGTDHNASGWLSYAFIILSYCLLIITPFLIKNSPNKTVLGAPIYFIGAVYFLIELIVGIVFILLNQDKIKVSFTVQIIMFGLYLILLFSNLLANEATIESIEKKQSEMQFIKYSSLRLKKIMDDTSDKKVYKKIEKAYDILNSSPVASSETVKNIELNVMQLIYSLESIYKNGDSNELNNLLNEITKLINERNDILKH